jgi:hypothetical protein
MIAGRIPGDGAGIHTRIDEALAVLRQDRADTAPQEPQDSADAPTPLGGLPVKLGASPGGPAGLHAARP